MGLLGKLIVVAIPALLYWLFGIVPLIVLGLLIVFITFKLSKNMAFWESRGVPGPRFKMPWGSEFGPPFTRLVDFDTWLYDQHGGKRYCGYFEFGRPVLFVGDLELVRHITIKDFDSFTDRRALTGDVHWKGALTHLRGAEWKKTRAVMTPTFSSSKLKSMHDLTQRNAANLVRFVRAEMEAKGEVDLKDAFERFTMDNIAACAFGVACNSFTDSKNRFGVQAEKLFGKSLMVRVRIIASLFLPRFLADLLPNPRKEANDFFTDVVCRTIEHREREGSSARDYLQLLMETKDKDGSRVLSNESIVSQAVLFFMVGRDTVNTLLTFAAYALATAPEVQERAREEVDAAAARHGGLTYDALQELPCLDRVLSETLRLYGPSVRTERVATRDYTLPGDARVGIPAGTLVQIPFMAIHRDPEHWPDPLRFDPDRFLPEQREHRHPCAFVPFGSGPRSCIAMRFALFEAKLVLASLLKEVVLRPTERTPSPPCPLEKKTIITTPQGDKMCLKVAPRGKKS